jgi:hypothetical protein
MAFPIVRWGRHVYSSVGLIDAWLAQVGKLKAEAKRKGERLNCGSTGASSLDGEGAREGAE